eukprot:TRINITY_DN3854_c0_g1_i1.p1 TRINITY_DN3854_c0_g1~~TRINITY_DN3854_c0_g1_i1.p1  ORF type:complete len:620 (-),score=171.56 TRINITY_DN3854_c0_g1_i1:394-2253(-)
MPPRKPKQVDPEVLRKQFEDWQLTKEYQLWGTLYHMRSDFPANLSETTSDISEGWQRYHDTLSQLCVELKIKPKKPFFHDYIRTGFFIQEFREGSPEEGVYLVYGKKFVIKRESRNACQKVRNNFIAIWKKVEELVNLDESNFQKTRKEMIAALKEFNTRLLEHIKSKAHDEATELLEFQLSPLESLLKSNIKWKAMYEACNYDEDRVFVNGFREKALSDKFCDDLDLCLRIMYEYCKLRPGITTPEIQARRILNKFRYEGWRKNKVESYYIEPLWNEFYLFTSNLGKLFAMGKDYWKLPLEDNKGLKEDLIRVIDKEIIAEYLLGTPLRRDQINFLFDVLYLIFKSKKEARQILLLQENPDAKMIDIVIPRLTIFKTIQHMAKVLARKEEDKANAKEETKREDQPKEQLPPTREADRMAGTNRTDFSKTHTSFKLNSSIEEKSPDQLEDEEAAKYGRLFLWKDYMSPGSRDALLKMTKELGRINEAVHMDIEDYIIALALPSSAQGVAKSSTFMMKKGGEREKSLEKKGRIVITSIVENRPPFLWNDPKILEEEHKFRETAKPQEAYIDRRVEKFSEGLRDLAEDLRKTEHGRWKILVERTIEVLRSLPVPEEHSQLK